MVAIRHSLGSEVLEPRGVILLVVVFSLTIVSFSQGLNPRSLHTHLSQSWKHTICARKPTAVELTPACQRSEFDTLSQYGWKLHCEEMTIAGSVGPDVLECTKFKNSFPVFNTEVEGDSWH